jgi:hypothetical protein
VVQEAPAGGYESVAKLDRADRAELPPTQMARLRITGTNDLSETSTFHGLQIGPDGGQHFAADQNEVGSRMPDGTWADLFLFNPRASLPQGTAASALTRKDYVDGLHSSATISTYATGWAKWADGVYQDLMVWIEQDGTVHMSGVAKFVGGTGATTTVLTLGGNYRPKNGAHIILGTVNDVARFINVSTAGTVFLRGALPSAGQFLAINASWPGLLSVASAV